MQKRRIPDKTPVPEHLVRRMQWKSTLGRLDARCRKDTGASLAELLVELQIEAAKRRRPKKRARRVSRKAVDTPATD